MPSTATYANAPGLAKEVRERDPNCIEMHLKNIEAEVADLFNSAENLADKLRGSEKPKMGGSELAAPPADIQARLGIILSMIRSVSTQLSHAHGAISG